MVFLCLDWYDGIDNATESCSACNLEILSLVSSVVACIYGPFHSEKILCCCTLIKRCQSSMISVCVVEKCRKKAALNLYIDVQQSCKSLCILWRNLYVLHEWLKSPVCMHIIYIICLC